MLNAFWRVVPSVRFSALAIFSPALDAAGTNVAPDRRDAVTRSKSTERVRAPRGK
jgi:glutaminase